MKEQDMIEILLVEDNPNDVELALYAFAQHKFANPIVTARDGEEALDYLFCTGKYADRTDQRNPCVVLLDLKLPKVDGLEVLKIIKSDNRTRMIPVIILTSSNEETDLVKSYHLGVNSYILKPVDFDQFVEAMRHLGNYWLLLNHPPKLTQENIL